jgi:uncharacterized membrane protein YdjX (TVP38/TMEM64 family)
MIHDRAVRSDLWPCLLILWWAGASFGAVGAFLLGRYLLHEEAQALFRRYGVIKALDRAFEGQGLKIMVLLRLSPLVPFLPLNYIM